MKSYFYAFFVAGILLFSSASRSEEFIRFTHPQGTSSNDLFLRNMTCYLLDLASNNFNPKCLVDSYGSLPTRGLPLLAIEELRAAKVDGTDVFNLRKLREWSNTWSYGLRNRRMQLAIITDRLSDFRKITGYKSWPQEIIVVSSAKQKTRVIYRSPWAHPFGLSVAETYESMTGDLTQPIIDTEIAMDRIDGSGNADFYSYNSAGQLSTTSLFPGGARQVPGFCMGCHYSAENNNFRRVIFSQP